MNILFRDQKTINILLGVVLNFSTLSVLAASSPSESEAKTQLANHITTESEGRIKLINFKQESGKERGKGEHKSYVLKYRAEIEFTEDCRWKTKIPRGFVTEIAPKKTGDTWSDFLSTVGEHADVKRGEQYEVLGEMIYEVKDGMLSMFNDWPLKSVQINGVGYTKQHWEKMAKAAEATKQAKTKPAPVPVDKAPKPAQPPITKAEKKKGNTDPKVQIASKTKPETNTSPKTELQKPEYDISGPWQTKWGVVTFTVSGNNVTGSYPHDSGKISAILSGNILKGNWSESPTYAPPKDQGEFEFIFSSPKKFTGKWRYGSSGNWSTGWNGSR